MLLGIIDAKNLVYRVEWTHRDLHDFKGRRTGMIYGTLNSLISLKRKYNITRFIFLWDSESNWRVDKYPWYKDGRVNKPDSGFIEQINILRERVLPLIGIDQLEADGFEADDLASWLVMKYFNIEKLLISNDHDWLQLVRPGTRLLRPCRKRIYHTFDVEETEGLTPKQLPLYWSFIGDDSDSIKGIYRIYKSHVKQLVRDCETMKELLVKVAKDEKTREWEKLIVRNFDLIDLEHSAYKIEEIKCVRSVNDPEQFQSICKEYNMLSFLGRYGDLV